MWILYAVAYLIIGVIMGFVAIWFQDNVLNDPIPDWERAGPIFVCAFAWPFVLVSLAVYGVIKLVHWASEAIIDKFEGG